MQTGLTAFARTLRRPDARSAFGRACAGLLLSVAGAAAILPPTPAQATPSGEDIPAAARYVRAKVVHSLEETFVGATNRKLGPQLAQVVKRVLVWWVNPRRDLRKGDVIEVVFEERVGEEPLLHAVWMYSQKKRKNLSAVRYKAEGARFHRYYTASGYEVERRLKRSPVRDYEQITSLLGDGRGHKGIDFKAPIGTPIYSPFNAVVTRRNWSTRRNGRCLELRDRRTGRRVLFLHLNSIVRRVRPGARIRRGQKIATLGNTGHSSAPHLHYQIQRTRRGRVLNPLRVHGTYRKRLKADEARKVALRLETFAQMRTGST